MELWILIFVIGLLSYFLVKRSAGPQTKTPIWILWLVIMAPAFSCGLWLLFFGEDKPIPVPLFLGILFISIVIYSSLVAQTKTLPKPESKPNKFITEESEKVLDFPPQKIRPISPSEETALRDCFPWNVYYLQNIDYHPQAILCRGKLKTVPEDAYSTIKKNIERVFGKRFLIVFHENYTGQPFFALVPNVSFQQNQLDEEPITKPFLALTFLALTFLTTTIYGLEINEIVWKQLQDDPLLILSALPYSLGIILVFGTHELGHYLTAIHYKMKATLPYFIPFPWFLGTFGAFIQMRSPFPHRKALFDVSIAGPIASFVASLPLLFLGLSQSEVVDISNKPSLLNFEAFDPRFSLLMSVISKMSLGSNLAAEKAIDLHPAAVAGYVGILITALNLVPIGQLDGGRIVHAMFGQAKGAVIGQITRLFMFVLALIQQAFLPWAIILFFMPASDQPALNDVTELDNKRDFLGLLSLILLITILLPLPGALASWLNI